MGNCLRILLFFTVLQGCGFNLSNSNSGNTNQLLQSIGQVVVNFEQAHNQLLQSQQNEVDFIVSNLPTGVRVVCEFNSQIIDPCFSPRSFDNLSDGQHTFKVQALLDSGQSERLDLPQGMFEFRVDTQKPILNKDKGPQNISYTKRQVLTWTKSEELSKIKVLINDQEQIVELEALDLNASLAAPIVFANQNSITVELSEGAQRIELAGIDFAGRESEMLRWEFDLVISDFQASLKGIESNKALAGTHKIMVDSNRELSSAKCRLGSNELGDCRNEIDISLSNSGSQVLEAYDIKDLDGSPMSPNLRLEIEVVANVPPVISSVQSEISDLTGKVLRTDSNEFMYYKETSNKPNKILVSASSGNSSNLKKILLETRLNDSDSWTLLGEKTVDSLQLDKSAVDFGALVPNLSAAQSHLQVKVTVEDEVALRSSTELRLQKRLPAELGIVSSNYEHYSLTNTTKSNLISRYQVRNSFAGDTLDKFLKLLYAFDISKFEFNNTSTPRDLFDFVQNRVAFVRQYHSFFEWDSSCNDAGAYTFVGGRRGEIYWCSGSGLASNPAYSYMSLMHEAQHSRGSQHVTCVNYGDSAGARGSCDDIYNNNNKPNNRSSYEVGVLTAWGVSAFGGGNFTDFFKNSLRNDANRHLMNNFNNHLNLRRSGGNPPQIPN